VNEVDLDAILGTDVVLSGTPIDTGRPIPPRIVRKCEVCTEGKVILTRSHPHARDDRGKSLTKRLLRDKK